MITFFYDLSLAYVAATLLTSGSGHLLAFADFCALVRAQGIIPARFSGLASIAVVAFELSAASSALTLLVWKDVATLALFLLAGCTVSASVFVLYVRRLLQMPRGVVSCGCSPFARALTPASILPATALLLVSVAGLIAIGFGSEQTLSRADELPSSFRALSLVWGVTLAGLIILIPASMPQPGEERRA